MPEPVHFRKAIQTKPYDLRVMAESPEQALSEIVLEIAEKANSLLAEGASNVKLTVRNVREKLSNPDGNYIYIRLVGIKEKYV